MSSLCTQSFSGLPTFSSSWCLFFTFVFGIGQVQVSAAAIQHRVEGRDANHDTTHLSSTDHTSLSLIRREAEGKTNRLSDAAENDRAQMIDARAPLQASNRGAWWFWPEPEPQPMPALAPVPEPVPVSAPAPAPLPARVLEKQPIAPQWPFSRPFVDNRHIDEIATGGETAFFQSLEAEIRKTWFLHGQSVIIMIAHRPYLVSPDSSTPVKHPNLLLADLGQGQNSANPESVAQQAYAKRVAELVIWVPDAASLAKLVRDFSIEKMASLQEERKLRGFWKGEEHSTRHLDQMKKTDFLKLGMSTMWLRGGLGRENLMTKAMRSTVLGQFW